MTVDLSFPLAGGGPIPADHAYPLYAALCRRCPALHEDGDVGVHPIRGRQVGDRLMQLMPWSELTLRLPAGRIPDLLPLAGEAVEIAGTTFRLRPPTVRALRPAPALRSRLVTIKPRDGFTDEAFAAAARRQLDALHVSPAAVATVGRRRTLRIKGREILGHELILEGLTAAESLAVQETGLGGRRSMGCGLFVPLNRTEVSDGV